MTGLFPPPRRILFDNRWTGAQGIARFGDEVFRRIPGLISLPSGLPLFHPLDPWRLSRLIDRLKPDIYFSPGFNPPLSSSVPFLFMVHDLNYVQLPQYSNYFRRAYFRHLVRPACRRAARVLTVSEYSKSQIVEWAQVPEAQVVNVGAGVGVEFSPVGPRYDPGYPYILYVGNRLAHKNVPRLIQAFIRARLACKLLLTGDSDVTLLELAAREGGTDKIEFAGRVPNERLPDLYRGAIALALPSLYEGFGLPVIEAMACGTPVLASMVTSLPEISGDAALLVDPHSVEAITEGLRRLASDETLRSALKRKGQERALRFTWDATVANIVTTLAAVSK